MSQTAKVKIELTADARLAALDVYKRRAAEVTAVTAGLRTTLAGVGGLLAAGGLATGFASASAHLNTLASDIARTAGRVQLGGEAYQVFGHILKGAGGDASDLTAALGILRNAIGEALRNPESSLAKTFSDASLSARQLSAAKPHELMETVARALAKIEDPARRASIAQDLLGRGANSLIPLLDRLGTEGYGKLRDEVAQTAGIMSDDMARALDDVGNRVTAASNRAALAMGPMVVAAQEAKAAFAEMLAGAAEVAAAGAKGLPTGFGSFFQGGNDIGWGSIAANGAAAVGVGAAVWGKQGLEMWRGFENAANGNIAKMPAWKSAGILFGVAAAALLAGANTIGGWQQAALAGQALDRDAHGAPFERLQKFREQMRSADSPELMGRMEVEAARRAREAAQHSWTEQDATLKANLEQVAKQYWGLVNFAREHGKTLVENNRAAAAAIKEREEAAKLATDVAWRDKEAYDWTQKEGKVLEAQTAEQRRHLQLAQLDAEQRLIVLNYAREAALQAQQNFSGTDYEREKKRIETEAKVLSLDQEIAAARREIASETERAEKAKEHEADAAERAAAADRKRALAEWEGGVDANLRDMRAQDGRNQADFRMTAEEKRRLHIAALEAEQSQLDSAAVTMRRQGDAEGARRYADRSIGIGGELASARAGTPETALEGLEAGLTRIQDRWGTLASQMQNGVASIGDAISGSLAGGMERLLGTTDFWTQKLGAIGPIMGSITGAISRMFAEWVIGLAAKAAKEIVFAGTTAKATAAIQLGTAAVVAPSLAAIWAGPATLATIATLGAAAAQAPASILAAKGIVVGSSVAGFFEGGFTGLGNPHDPAGIVHRGEFVIPHDVTRTVGPGALAGLVESVRNPSQTTFGPEALMPQVGLGHEMAGASRESAADSIVPQPRVLLVDHREQDLIERLVADPRYKTSVRRIGRNNPGDFGSQT